MFIRTTTDFAAPRATVLARLNDPARVEAVLGGLGAGLTRQPDAGGARHWQGRARWRNATQSFALSQRGNPRGEPVILLVEAALADVRITLGVADLPTGGCHVTAEAEVTAHQLMARIALSAAALVRGRLEKRLARLVRALGKP